MRFQTPEELKEFTEATKYCDSDSKEVTEKAQELVKDCLNTTDAALQIHRYVRDHFKFGFTPVTEKASETLQGNLGWCVTKTNLQIALLRSIGIPARYHQVTLSKTSLEGIISKTIYRTIKEPIWFHPWCECALDGKWIACDLFIDQLTYKAAIKAGLYSESYFPTVEWNGRDDLIIVNHWKKEDRGVHQSYDEVIDQVDKELSKGPSFLLNMLVRKSNRYTERFRNEYS